MTRYDLQHWDACSDDAEADAPIDVLIRPGLRRAFPLPADDHANDDRFRRVLEALAQQQKAAVR